MREYEVEYKTLDGEVVVEKVEDFSEAGALEIVMGNLNFDELVNIELLDDTDADNIQGVIDYDCGTVNEIDFDDVMEGLVVEVENANYKVLVYKTSVEHRVDLNGQDVEDTYGVTYRDESLEVVYINKLSYFK